ncbi:MAG TPA: nitronate monooxygenase [Deltaproteobacteria bacterium]|nr:nitronate monooxygenase [Deltaproteobacteria bacterium]HCP45027.1 nitronate monooxygenase [Deltaproteobacteria bacterium]
MQARFQTRITELFGIEHPLLCGGLMWLADARYVGAVVNAGAMGFITPRSFPDLDAFRAQLADCQEITCGRPFGVNLYISGQANQNDRVDAWIEASLGAGVRHFETAGFSPSRWLPRLQAEGAVVIHKCTTIRHALRAERDGVDAVALVGHECGGHPGTNTLSAATLGSLAAEQLRVPFVLGGGMGTGSQLVSALSLGADGVLLGSRMLVSEEIWAHENYKNHLVDLDASSTTTVLSTFGKTYRCLDNEAARRVRDLEAQGISDFDAYRDLVRGEAARTAYETGDWSHGILSLGPAISFADTVEPAADIIQRFIHQAQHATERVGHLNPTHPGAR